MAYQKCVAASVLLVTLLFPAFGQNISSSVKGILVDPSGAPIPGASVSLVNESTGAALSASSSPEGAFTFPSVLAGEYTLSIEAAGFKALQVRGIIVTASEVRTLGSLKLQVGEVRDSVTVTAEAAAAIQLATAEKSGLINAKQLNDIAIKGRDPLGLLLTIPGIVDNYSRSRETSTDDAIGGIFINGGRQNQKNVTVDGIVAMDITTNEHVAALPNMDAISEVKILTSNYQAEYGRNSGGAITFITKSGAKQFHGAGYSFYRHESLNATDFFDNRTGTPKAPYRYRISGFSLGGPLFVPRKFNTGRDRLFFFFSQEYTGMRRDYGTRFVNTPTEAERRGDYADSRDVNGALIAVKDPVSGQNFPGNAVPLSRINKLGQAVLNFFPAPNYTDPDPRNRYRWNYRSVYSGDSPKRNDVLRFDANVTPSLLVYYRYLHIKEDTVIPYGDWKIGNNYLLTPILFHAPGGGHSVHVTKTVSPTLVNEARFGYTLTDRSSDLMDRQAVDRSRMGNIPQWFPDTHPAANYVPDVSFGGQPSNTIAVSLAVSPYTYRNPLLIFTDNLNKVWRGHNVKVGVSLERATVNAIGESSRWRGRLSFSRDTNNPFDANHSFANALLGNFQSYSETTARLDSEFLMWNVEWYMQDNWRVTPRLTLDVGVRWYYMPPMWDRLGNTATFDPALYDRAKAPTLYMPTIDGSGRRVAMDPKTGTLAAPPLIGQYVPGSGDFANGTAVGGKNGYPAGLYTRPWLALGPRFGFAYDLFGNGRTALRGGFGVFKDTAQNNPVELSNNNPPLVYTPTLYYGNLDTFKGSGGAVGPTSVQAPYGRGNRLPSTMNFSLGLQHQVRGTVIDVSYVGGLSRHLLMTRELNAIAMYARFDARNADPTRPGSALPDNFFRPLAGYASVNPYQFGASSNYHALQVGANRRLGRGIQFGLAYTRSKTLGVASNDSGSISPYFPARSRNYGPLSYDRPNVFVLNYMYAAPKVGSRIGWKPASWVLDDWQVSGITTFSSGAPFTPGFGTVDGQDITGSSEGARITVVGDPRLAKSERSFYRNFRTEVFQRTPLRDFGNAGLGLLYGPGVNNWDISISKRVPLRSEERFVQFRTELFNAWNHTQFSGLYTSARFDARGNQVDANFGAYSSARAARRIQLSLRVVF